MAWQTRKHAESNLYAPSTESDLVTTQNIIVLAAAKTFNSDFCRQVTNALY